MSPMAPFAVYGLRVPTGEVMVPAEIDFPATIRITMAAIDPTQVPEPDEQGDLPAVPRATLKMLKMPVGDEDSDDEEGDDYLQSILANSSDDEDEEDDKKEEVNGGPSDPSKAKKARKAAIKKLLANVEAESSDEDMEDAGGKPNGIKKGKAKANDEDDDSDSDSDDEDVLDGLNLEEFVLCTLDTERTYQQPLDITISAGEKVFFLASGSHTIHLMGNYVMLDDENQDEDSDDDYDLHPGIDLLDDDDDEDDEDSLDHLEDTPRVQEVGTDDEEAPKLIEKSSKKGKNKRPVEDEADGLDDMIAKDEAKLSKKQRKKLKNNKGEAVAAETKAKESPAGKDKKVQFAKDLEQGPTGATKKADKSEKGEKKAVSNVKVVQGVTIDDRKIGTGRTVKAGDKVGMRYIGKLENDKVFDANKKGPPFSFKVGKGDVIKGWDIGIVGMAIGGERRLTIPANLAYGSKGVAGIPPNSTLKFDVKLLEIK